MLNFLLYSIHELNPSASETLRTIYLIGGTTLACVALILILNMAHKIDQLKNEIKKLQENFR